MKDQAKTKQVLIQELASLRERIAALGQSESGRRIASEALRETEEYFKAIIQNSCDIVLILDKMGNITYASPSVERFLGYTPDELIGKRTLDLILSADKPRAIADYGKALQTKEVLIPNSFRVKHKDGTERLLEGIGNNLLDNPIVAGLVMNVCDITDRKQAEEALRHSEENFRRSLDESPLGVRIVTEEGETIYANRAFLEINGYDSLEELTITPPWKQYTPESYAEHQIRKEKRRRGDDDPSEYIISIIKKDGEIRHLQVFRKEMLWGGKRQFQVLYNDITKRKRAEEELKRSEDVYRLLFENAGEGILIAQGDRIKFANRAFTEILGYPLDIITSTPFTSFIHPEDREMVFDRHTRRMNGEDIETNYSYRNVNSNGDVIWLQIHSQLVRWDDKPASLSFVSDVTDLKRAEEALKQSESWYRTIVENTGTAIVLVQEDTTIGLVNTEFEKLSGYVKSEIEGKKKWTEFVEQEDMDKMLLYHKLRRENTESSPKNYEFRFIDKGGNIKAISLSVDMISGTGISIASLLDVTDRKLAEQALKESENKYRALMDSTSAGIYLIRGNEFIYVNPAFEAITGYSLDELAGIPFWDFIHPDFRELVKRRGIRRQDGKEPPQRYEFKILPKGGQEKWIELSPISFDSAGKSTIMGSMFDITDRKRSEEEVTRTRDQLRALAVRLQEVREETQTAISQDLHDDVGGNLAGLKMDLMKLERIASKLNDVEQKNAMMEVSLRSRELINKTIQSARRIMMELRPSVLDDFGLVAALEWQVGEFKTHTGISCQLVADQQRVDLEKHAATTIFRIFQETLANVARHSRATGVVVRLLRDQNMLVLEVTDNGRGITEEQRSGKQSMGLMGMRERALALGGSIQIMGESGKGTTVTLRVPMGREG